MGHRKSSSVLTVVATAAVCAIVTAPANGAVTIGETFAATSSCLGPSQTYVQSGSAAAPAPQYTAPSAGVITSWSQLSGAAVPSFIRLKVVRPAGGPNFTTVGQSEREIPTANQLNTFGTRITVQSGDAIGFHYVASAPIPCSRVMAGYAFAFSANDAVPGTTQSYGQAPNFQFDVSAQLEPDADGDGFGDETQDLCPTQQFTQQACRDIAAPETTITEKPKKKTRKRKASFSFTSPEAGATFRCSLDGKPFESCASPQAVKAKVGFHTFAVVAKDAAGNADDSPATASWTVMKPKKK